MLLETCRVEDPEEAERAVLEGCSISAVVGEDLPFFTRLTHLDLGDNAVQLEGLAYLPALQELHLDCNGLTDLACPPGGFPRLEVLNLRLRGTSQETEKEGSSATRGTPFFMAPEVLRQICRSVSSAPTSGRTRASPSAW